MLVGAHYDSVIGSPVANDGAGGVAALPEPTRMACLGSDHRHVVPLAERDAGRIHSPPVGLPTDLPLSALTRILGMPR